MRGARHAARTGADAGALSLVKTCGTNVANCSWSVAATSSGLTSLNNANAGSITFTLWHEKSGWPDSAVKSNLGNGSTSVAVSDVSLGDNYYIGNPSNAGRVFDMPPVGNGNGNDLISCLTLAAGKPVLVGSGVWSGTDFDFSFKRLGNSMEFADGFESGSTFFWSATAH